MSMLSPTAAGSPVLRTDEQPVQFEVRGLRLYGILHRPGPEAGGSPAAVGVVLLGGWSGTRVGPHGILTRMARSLAEAGIPAIRFDYRGRGDSEGAQRQAHIGTMVQDAGAAAAFLQERTGVHRVMLLGICAGAQVAMGAAPGISNLAGLALWSPPPFHPDEPETPDASWSRTPAQGPASAEIAASAEIPAAADRRRKRPGRRGAMLAQYARKLFDRRTWAKLAGGQLQPRLILKILSGRAVDRAAASAPEGEAAPWAGPKPDEREYERALRGVKAPALFIYGSGDPEQVEAMAYYTRLRRGPADGSAPPETGFHVVQRANHSFYSLEWKQEVIVRTLEWIVPQCAESST